MTEYYYIEIAGIPITRDATESGDKYIATVEGMGQFALTNAKTIVTALDGTSVGQYRSHAGAKFSVRFPLMIETDYESVRSAIDAADSAAAAFSVTIKRGSRTYDFSVIAESIEHDGEFIGDRIPNVDFSFVVQSLEVS